MKKIFYALCFMIPLSLTAQVNPREVITYCDSMLQLGIKKPMIPGAILSIVSRDSTFLNKGYGFSNYEKKIPVDPVKTLFQLGSVGKVFTSIAALQQIQKGKLALKSDVNQYLKGWKIENKFKNPVTLFHLLTHSAGFDDRIIGYMSRSTKSLKPLKEHLPVNMPQLFQSPGLSINYSNYSYALAGHLVELRSRQPFAAYIKQNIFGKLGMNESTYNLPDNHENLPQYALGYKWRKTFEKVKAYPRHATPAGSILSTADDMSLFMQALLKQDAKLLNSKIFNLLLSQQFTNHPLQTGYTLGLEVQNFGGQIVFAKGGNVLGFISVFILFPQHNLGIFLSANTQTDNFFEIFWAGFQQKFFPGQKTTQSKHSQNINLREYTGTYSNERTNHHTLEQMFALFSGRFDIWRSKFGHLACYHNGKTHQYVVWKPDIFRHKTDPHQYLVFKRNNKGKVTTLFRNINIGGIQVPNTYVKTNWFNSPDFLNEHYAWALITVCTYLLLPFFWVALFFMRKKKPHFSTKTRIPAYYHATALVFVGLLSWSILGFFIPLIKNTQQLLFDFPESLTAMKYFHWMIGLIALGLIFLAMKLWFRKSTAILVKLYYTLFSLAALSYPIVLHHWHFFNVIYR